MNISNARTLALGLFALEFTRPALLAQTDWMALTLQASWPGYKRSPAVSVTVVSNLAYTALESGLAIFDVSNPANPVRVGSYGDGGTVWDLDVPGNYAYLAGGGQVKVIDVSNPAKPVRAAVYHAGTSVYGVYAVGNHAYVAAGSAGLLILEIIELPYFTAVSCSGDRLVLTWNGAAGLTLQRTSSLTNPDWTDVPSSDGQSRMELPMGGRTGFFRLVKR